MTNGWRFARPTPNARRERRKHHRGMRMARGCRILLVAPFSACSGSSISPIAMLISRRITTSRHWPTACSSCPVRVGKTGSSMATRIFLMLIPNGRWALPPSHDRPSNSPSISRIFCSATIGRPISLSTMSASPGSPLWPTASRTLRSASISGRRCSPRRWYSALRRCWSSPSGRSASRANRSLAS